MQMHLLWLWLWFLVGMAAYWLKRAYYGVSGINPVASSYGQWLSRCSVPLLVRALTDSVIFWLCFTPQLLTQGLNYFGWSSFSGVVGLVTQFAPISFLFGNFVDALADLVIDKVPFLKGWLPQMPEAIPSKSPTNLQVTAQQAANKGD
jgi:hypothetical protein